MLYTATLGPIYTVESPTKDSIPLLRTQYIKLCVKDKISCPKLYLWEEETSLLRTKIAGPKMSFI